MESTSLRKRDSRETTGTYSSARLTQKLDSSRADSRIALRIPAHLIRRIRQYGRTDSEFTRAALEYYLRSLDGGLDTSLSLSPVIVQVVQNGQVIATGTLQPTPYIDAQIPAK